MIARLTQLAERLLEIGTRLVERLLTLEIVDRSLVVGAQAFSALIPLLIVLSSVSAADGSSFGDALVHRFDLHGAAAQSVRSTFAAPANSGGLTVISGVVVVFSALAFTRALQRTFELTWNLPRRGMRSTGWGLIWLGVCSLYFTLFPALDGVLHGTLGKVVAIAGSFGLWLVTPYLLLARRVPWRRLRLQAGLTAIGMTVVSAGSAIYIPRAMSSAAEQFGAIGVAFTLLSLLWAAGFVVVTAAALGAYHYVPQWSLASAGSATRQHSSSSVAPGS